MSPIFSNQASCSAMALALLRRDLVLVYRRRSDALTVLVFFSIVVSLFPLGVGADPSMLRLIGGGVVWVAALGAVSPLVIVHARDSFGPAVR
jgi:heme exporter protein CcmB